MKAIVDVAGKKRRMDAHAMLGQWAITNPLVGATPIECSTVVVTHQPTGLRACDMRKKSDYTKILERFNALFGRAVGVMRKWKALTKKDQTWVKKFK